MKDCVLAIDQGTTGTTALLFDARLNILGKETVEFPQHFPKASWVEHDLDEIWKSVVESVRRVLAKRPNVIRHIVAIGITNQRETTCLWHRDEKGRPFTRAIVWQDRRTADICAKLKKAGEEKWIRSRTGLCLDPYFSGTKIYWMLSNFPKARQLAENGKILFGNIDAFLLYRMSGNHFTDVSNASRTLLMDLKGCQWNDDLLRLFKIPKKMLPQIRSSSVEYGKTRGFPGLPDGIPITGMAGDQQSALFGQACFEKGDVKCTYGTGAFALLNTGTEIRFSKHNLLTTVAWKFGERTTYGIEGSAFIAGAAVQWIRDGLKLISSAPQIEALAKSVPDSDGVVFVPALTGMGAPYWEPKATGLVTGITRRTNQGHIARATLEGVASQVADLIEAMTADYGKKLTAMKVDGGASQNGLLMQFQADMLAFPVIRSKIMETTALGAGLQAGLGVGLWRDLYEIKSKWKAAAEFKPKMKKADRDRYRREWSRAVSGMLGMAKG